MGKRSHIEEEVTAIIEKFNRLTYHPFLNDYIPEVGIDEGKCKLFYAALAKKVPKEEASVVTLCVMLVQAALDVHEQVSLHEVDSDTARKHRQLRVLVGDFYSSLYYYLLAEADRVPLTRIFSFTLQEINEMKMEVYSTSSDSYEDIANKLVFIESILYEKILEEYNLQELKPFFQLSFYYHRFMAEWNYWSQGQNSTLMSLLINSSGSDSAWQRIHHKQEQLRKEIDQLTMEQKGFTQELELFLQESVPAAPTGFIEGRVQ
ncbi:heptaprenyl diphosphate synthase component 1 [Alkalicoccobacillus porphyridii]|uniref:Heptaprenyl diphosphate synthase n=1 Tax=Alkalicoccobacillus porphyridii TaxID=2597270 RepID=A0A553ZZU0_9BACI|nr:heptaprenyl diphosphate synthase component 1 [Alkalicoccobacillus porphyridii]TSB46906.1 heptaprenyl diphosphate synthase [Alkalicoccobacillus porphyridii]